MKKVLGSISLDYKGLPNALNDFDTKVMQDIIKLHASSRPLHAQILLQSMQYTDCAFEALSGEYRRELGHKPTDSIHAVIADNRFGLFHSTIPSVYITHQLLIKTGDRFSEKILQKIHGWIIKKYTHVTLLKFIYIPIYNLFSCIFYKIIL
jgi:hypothetical protein